MAKTVNGFELPESLANLVSRMEIRTTDTNLKRYNMKHSLSGEEQVRTLMDLYKNRMVFEALEPSISAEGIEKIRIGEYLTKYKSALNGSLTEGVDKIVSRHHTEQAGEGFWVTAGDGYYDRDGSNIEPSMAVNLKNMEGDLSKDLASNGGQKGYCVPGGYTGLMIILATAPHDMIAKYEPLISASFATLQERGVAELGKYAPKSPEHEELKEFAENLKFMKQTYGLMPSNEQARQQENAGLMDF